MRRCKPIRLGELWQSFVSENPEIERRIREGRIPEVWREVAGERIADLTTSVTFRNGILTVCISSAVVRQEIFIRRASFAQIMNERLGSPIIRTLIVR